MDNGAKEKEDEGIVLWEKLRANGELLRATMHEHRGVQYYSIRCFWRREGEEWRPGKNGITVPLAEAADLLDAADAITDHEVLRLHPPSAQPRHAVGA